MNNITRQFDKNYGITKKVIEDMLIDNSADFIRVIGGIIPMPIESSTCYIIQGVTVDGEGEASTGFAIYNGELISVYGGAFTGFYAYIETTTNIDGTDSFGNPYKTELINKKLAPSQSGISYNDMIRIELAIKQPFSSNPSISSDVDSRFVIGASNCHITQFNRAQFDVDYNEHIVNSNPIIIGAGWNNVHTIPVAYRTTAGIDVTGIATMTHGSVVKLVPVRIVAGVVQFYEEDGFVTSDFLLNVRFDYAL